MDDGFSNKEVLIEIKDDLKDFRDQYTEDQETRHIELAKRPTRGELWSLVAGVGTMVGLTLAFTGG